MRIMPRAQREAMFEIYAFCRAVDDIADEDGSREVRIDQLQRWRADIDALYSGSPAPHIHGLARAVRIFDLQREDFLAVIDGMEMDVVSTIRAPDLATLDLYCDRVASAVGRLSVRVFRMEKQAGIALAYHLGRALQLTNILRDLDEDAAVGRLYLPKEALLEANITTSDPLHGAFKSNDWPRLRSNCRTRRAAIRGSRCDYGTKPAPGSAHAAHHGGSLPFDAGSHDRARMASAPRTRQTAAKAISPHTSAIRHRVMARLVHIVGAGLAGLSAAVKLASQGVRVSVHEATNQAGGRCRSYFDTTLGMTIDNGNHLVLSGNHATLTFLDKIGARDQLSSPKNADIPFLDLSTGTRWTIRANDGLVPWWILDPKRRVPGTRARDYLSLLRLLRCA